MISSHSTSSYSPISSDQEQSYSPLSQASQLILPPLTLPSPQKSEYYDATSPKHRKIIAIAMCNDKRLPSIRSLEYNDAYSKPVICQTPTAPVLAVIPEQRYPHHAPRTLYKPYHYPNVAKEQRIAKDNTKHLNQEHAKRQNNENIKKRKPEKARNRCHSCNSTETPEWRKGPLGPRTLCNACGLIWIKLCKQKEEAAASSSPVLTTSTKITAALTTMTATAVPTSTKHLGQSPPGSLYKELNVNDTTISEKKPTTKKYTLSYLLS